MTDNLLSALTLTQCGPPSFEKPGYWFRAVHFRVPLFQNESRVTSYLCFKTSLELPCASVSKRVFMQNMSDLHKNEPVGGTHFRYEWFALGLVLTERKRELGNGRKSVFNHASSSHANLLEQKKVFA